METIDIISSARHGTSTINYQVVRGCLRIRQESAPANQSCVTPMKFPSQSLDYLGGRALSRLVAVGGVRHDFAVALAKAEAKNQKHRCSSNHRHIATA
jgi:hypothetical protein